MRFALYQFVGATAALLTLAACTGGAPAAGEASTTAASPSAAARCDAQPAQAMVGQLFTQDTLARVQAATGAHEARLLRPDSMVTKEFKLGRVNVVVDANQRVVGIHCG